VERSIIIGMLNGARTPRSHRLLLLLSVPVLIAADAACTTGADSYDGGSWSRSYLSAYGRVFEAVLDSLEAGGFYLDTIDENRGRVRAESSARRRDLEMTLFVDVEQRGDRIRVDVMAQGSGSENGYAPTQMSPAVYEFLRELDARLEGRKD
jgi:hypothetical protein